MTDVGSGLRNQPPRVGRRALLLTVCGVGVTLATSAPAWSIVPGKAAITPTALAEVATTSGGVAKVPAFLGGQVAPAGASLPAESIFTIAWDTRLYVLGASPRLTDEAGDQIRCEFQGSSKAVSENVRQVQVKVGAPLRDGQTYVLNAGAKRDLRYPNDLISKPLSADVAVGGSMIKARTLAPVDEGKPSDGVWGAIVGTGWKPVAWDNVFYTWLPEIVTIRSVGPAPIPAGTLIEVQFDARLASAMSFVDTGRARLSTTRSQSSTSVTVSHALAEEIPAESRYNMLTLASLRKLGGSIPGIQPPTVQVRAAEASTGQRATGEESQVRMDSATDMLGIATYGDLFVASR